MGAAAAELPVDVSYSLRASPSGDRTRLHVRVRLRGDPDGVTRVGLPQDAFGLPEIHTAVVDLAVEGAVLAPVAYEPDRRDLRHAPGAEIELSYVVDWDPGRDTGQAYRPDVGPAHFHFFGSQWRINLPERERPQSYELRFEDLPAGWAVCSNLGSGRGPFRVESADAEFVPFVAGGEYSSSRFVDHGTDVSVFVGGGFEDRARVARDVRRAVELLSESFGGTQRSFYVVCVTGRGDVRAGVAIDNAFVCLVDPEVDPQALLKLVTHETLHNWLPGIATIAEWAERGVDAVDEYRFDWFVEGFTEYCTRTALRRAGLFDEDDFVRAFNRDLRELARNPLREASLEQVAEALRNGTYSNKHERLNYVRGPLLGLRWDIAQRAAGGPSVDEIVHAFLERGSAAGGRLTAAEFFGLLEEHGVDGRSDYERFIVAGEPLAPPADAFGEAFVLEELELEVYDPGFDTLGSRLTGAALLVDERGAAHRAGLREGEAFVGYESERDPQRPARVTIRRDGGERAIEFLPSSTVQTVRFVRR